jgi:hypothetical protein
MPLPIPAPVPSPTPVLPARRLYVRERQDFATENERIRQNQAIYMYGEYVMFILMWHIQDLEAGRITRCSRCYGDGTTLEDRVANVYNQPTQQKCPTCFGTTFEGGYKARIIRPAIITDSDKDDANQARGVTHSMSLDVESISDFRIRSGDYMFRSNGDRFYLRTPARVTLRTGFYSPRQSNDSIDYNLARAGLEDRKAVAYDIPPPASSVETILSEVERCPTDFTAYEEIKADLIPSDDD